MASRQNRHHLHTNQGQLFVLSYKNVGHVQARQADDNLGKETTFQRTNQLKDHRGF
jgi:hypothetical protein